MNRCGQNNRFSFLSLIRLFDQYFHSGFGYLSICCPTVLVGMTASLEIGELSNPII